jgi:hypothetical protein
VVLRKSVAVLSLATLVLGVARALPVILPSAREGPLASWLPFLLVISPAAVLTIGAFAAIILPRKALRRVLLALALLLLVGSALYPPMGFSSAIACLGLLTLVVAVRSQQVPEVPGGNDLIE